VLHFGVRLWCYGKIKWPIVLRQTFVSVISFSYIKQKQFCEGKTNIPVVAVDGVVVTVLTVVTVGVVKEVGVPVASLVVLAVVCDSVVNVVGVLALSKTHTQSFGTP